MLKLLIESLCLAVPQSIRILKVLQETTGTFRLPMIISCISELFIYSSHCNFHWFTIFSKYYNWYYWHNFALKAVMFFIVLNHPYMKLSICYGKLIIFQLFLTLYRVYCYQKWFLSSSNGISYAFDW